MGLSKLLDEEECNLMLSDFVALPGYLRLLVEALKIRDPTLPVASCRGQTGECRVGPSGSWVAAVSPWPMRLVDIERAELFELTERPVPGCGGSRIFLARSGAVVWIHRRGAHVARPKPGYATRLADLYKLLSRPAGRGSAGYLG